MLPFGVINDDDDDDDDYTLCPRKMSLFCLAITLIYIIDFDIFWHKMLFLLLLRKYAIKRNFIFSPRLTSVLHDVAK